MNAEPVQINDHFRNPKMGQRSFLWNIRTALYAKGNYIRNFDANGSFPGANKTATWGYPIYQVKLTVSTFSKFFNGYQRGREIGEEESYNIHIQKLKSIFGTKQWSNGWWPNNFW